MTHNQIVSIIKSTGTYVFQLNNMDRDFSSGTAVLKVIEIDKSENANVTLSLKGSLCENKFTATWIVDRAIENIWPIEELLKQLKDNP